MLPPTDVPSLPLLTILDFKPPALAALSFPSEPHSPALSCSPGTQMQEDMLDLTAPTSHQVSHKSRQAHDEPSGIAMHPFTMVKGNPSDPGSTAVASLPTIHSAYDAAALPMLMPDASMSRLTPPAFEPTVQAGSPESLGGTAPPLPKVGELSGTLPHPTVGPMPPMTDPAQEYRIQRARQRALRNRAAAQLSRDNRKRYIAELESRNARLKLENMQLRAAQEDPVRGGLATSAMAAELRRLRQQLAMMETLIAKSLQTISMHGDCPDVGLSFS
ncbi:hypothetical protein CXG81DRAFT_24487 [Caulochytrium protostelioides]|uniref:BZIP domain-containing protein n=1 Tax=Caulochytrium protostelioides TaxID=1555241 RepID=A0A4P9XBU9_9FUNG|nr:hypothetical protein CXG81DRAFT_24487 [Caulochytrium protostelioides]|eukprot:RKP02888.1 hypothetical protein CXG81DRAFT_24487 [Caulochytrium protostelioides]